MKFIIALVPFLLAFEASAALSPIYTVFNKLNSAFEGDKCFSVQRPAPPQDGNKLILIRVDACTEDAAKAWQLLKRDFTTSKVDLQFYYKDRAATPADMPSQISDVVNMINIMLSSNTYFSSALDTDCEGQPFCFYPYAVTVEMKPLVVQTFVDNIHDLYGNRTQTAADHFSVLLVDKIGKTTIAFTTQKKK